MGASRWGEVSRGWRYARAGAGVKGKVRADGEGLGEVPREQTLEAAFRESSTSWLNVTRRVVCNVKLIIRVESVFLVLACWLQVNCSIRCIPARRAGGQGVFWKKKDPITDLGQFAGKFLSFAVSEFSPPASLIPLGVLEKKSIWRGVGLQIQRFFITTTRDEIDFTASNRAALAWAEEQMRKPGRYFVALSGTKNVDGQDHKGFVTISGADGMGIYSFISVVAKPNGADVRLFYPSSRFLQQIAGDPLLEGRRIRQFNQSVRSAFESAPFQHAKKFELWPSD